MKRFTALVAVALVASALSTAKAALIFDDFNTVVGTHWNSSPNSSGTTNILKPVVTLPNANATVRTTVAPFEGAGALKLTIEGGGQSVVSPSFPRIRFVSGGGTPANNVSFTTTAGVDGFIGYYYKVPSAGTLPGSLPSGLQLTLNLDGPGGAAGVAAAGVAKNAIMDGAWHLVEWNLDNAADWGPFQGVGGDAVLDNATYTIDSMYFRYPVGQSWPAGGYTGTQDLFLDFFAKSDAGSIAGLLNTPPVIVPPAANPAVTAGTIILGDFNAVDTDLPAQTLTFGGLTLNSFAAFDPGFPIPNPAFNAHASIDPTTGVVTWDTTGFRRGVYDITATVTDSGSPNLTSIPGHWSVVITQVPEPATFCMLGLAAVGLVGFARRRNG